MVSFKSLDLIFSRHASHDVQLAVTKKEVLICFIGQSNAADSRISCYVNFSTSGCCRILGWWSDHWELDEIHRKNHTIDVMLSSHDFHAWMHACMLSHVQFFVTRWTVAHQAPLSMGFSRQEYWSGLPFTAPGTLLNPGIKHKSPAFPALAGRFFPPEPPRKPMISITT